MYDERNAPHFAHTDGEEERMACRMRSIVRVRVRQKVGGRLQIMRVGFAKVGEGIRRRRGDVASSGLSKKIVIYSTGLMALLQEWCGSSVSTSATAWVRFASSGNWAERIVPATHIRYHRGQTCFSTACRLRYDVVIRALWFAPKQFGGGYSSKA